MDGVEHSFECLTCNTTRKKKHWTSCKAGHCVKFLDFDLKKDWTEHRTEKNGGFVLL